MRHISHVVAAAGLNAGLVLCASAPAQSNAADAEEEFDPTLIISANGGFEHQFESGLDGGGDLSVSRIGAGLGATRDLNRDLNLTLSFGYGLEMYDFSGVTALGVDPWEDIHTFGGGVIFSLDLTNDFTVFTGPVFQSSRESGADWDDGFYGGGVGGAVLELSPELRLGGGIGVVSQIEDDLRFFPILVVDWIINDSLRLASQTTTGATGRQGIELICTGHGDWEFALGAASEFARFRLDGTGVAPDGIGEHESIPFWFRASCDVNENFRLDFLAGLNVKSELQIEDTNGTFIAKTDMDTAPFLGVYGNIQF